jgi:hypothetical protein
MIEHIGLAAAVGYAGRGNTAAALGSKIASVTAPVPFLTGNLTGCCSITGQAWTEERMSYFGTLRARLGWLTRTAHKN